MNNDVLTRMSEYANKAAFATTKHDFLLNLAEYINACYDSPYSAHIAYFVNRVKNEIFVGKLDWQEARTTLRAVLGGQLR